MVELALPRSHESFLRAFEETTLPRGEWTHAAHLRVAWLCLEQTPFAVAVERLRQGIRRYNASVGSQGYHETVTIAFARLVQHRRLMTDPRGDWGAFVAGNPDLFARAPILLRHYSKDTLDTAAAREGFVPPDRTPLPAGGDLRFVRPDDAERVAEIYAPSVEASFTSFELVAPGPSEMAGRIQRYAAAAPWLVHEVDGRVTGYAYASQHRERPAYRWAAEVSVYVAEEWHGRGVGSVLYRNLFRLLRELGYVQAFAGIALPNAASVALHERFGFQAIGVFRQIGFKMGAWRDVGWWQLALAPAVSDPSPPRKPGDVPLSL